MDDNSRLIIYFFNAISLGVFVALGVNRVQKGRQAGLFFGAAAVFAVFVLNSTLLLHQD